MVGIDVELGQKRPVLDVLSVLRSVLAVYQLAMLAVDLVLGLHDTELEAFLLRNVEIQGDRVSGPCERGNRERTRAGSDVAHEMAFLCEAGDEL